MDKDYSPLGKIIARSKFQTQLQCLIFKSYLQRNRRWRILALEILIAVTLSGTAVFLARPAFLIPLQTQPVAPVDMNEFFRKFDTSTIVGYAPTSYRNNFIMKVVSEKLNNIKVLSASSVDVLNDMLYQQAKGKFINNNVLWVVFGQNVKSKDVKEIVLKSSASARREMGKDTTAGRTDFLAVQFAIVQAILYLDYGDTSDPHQPTPNNWYELHLVAMPVSPLMDNTKVQRIISIILLLYTLLLLLPVLEVEVVVVAETSSRFKRNLRIRGVPYSVIYLHWIGYAFFTAVPICLVSSVALITIFRWVHLIYAMLALMVYVNLMMMQALLMAMFHKTPWTSCVWTTLFTMMQTFLAEMLVQHDINAANAAFVFMLNMFIPPLGLLNGFRSFALLQIGSESKYGDMSSIYTILSWALLTFLYFQVLMLLQWTIGQEHAIGGQVSWKSIIFKKAEDPEELHPIETPTGKERQRLQEVDEFVAKAISFQSVSKNVMHNAVLRKITFDIYRCEYTILFAERIQDKMLTVLEDLLCGLTQPDSGTINVLGVYMSSTRNFMTEPYMMGYFDCSTWLVDELTVEEHLIMFIDICLWNEPRSFLSEYSHLRLQKLMTECNLSQIMNVKVWQLDFYYRAQLCWALAILREPRVVIIPNFQHDTVFMDVLRDKIVSYKKNLTIVKMGFSAIKLEHADRCFIFDKGELAFGGTLAYMYFRHGRDYRIRLNLCMGKDMDDDLSYRKLQERAMQARAVVRAHLGALLILRVPATPTENMAAFVKDLLTNKIEFGINTISISVADTEEVFRRILWEARGRGNLPQSDSERIKTALRNIAEPREWKSHKRYFCNIHQMRLVAWKYFTFLIHYRFFFMITIIAALVTGVFLGVSTAKLLHLLESNIKSSKLIHGDVLTVESLDHRNTLVMRVKDNYITKQFANGYVLSHPDSPRDAVDKMEYVALDGEEDLMEYLTTCAMDAPQVYVTRYAYGMDVSGEYRWFNYSEYTSSSETDDEHAVYKPYYTINALYSPLNMDPSSAARSLSRVYMTLLRYFSGILYADFEFIDDPLVMDSTEWLSQGAAASTPLLIQFLLVLTITHMTLLPSKEYGLVRHTQAHARNFSPARYWLSLFVCDVTLYWILVGIMTAVMYSIVYMTVNNAYIEIRDMLSFPLLLCIYGVGCIPLAYLFGLGPRPALNSMAMVIVCIVFGETSILTKFFYGDAYVYALSIMSLSPQYNMAIAFVSIRKIFLYNSECKIFAAKNYCLTKILHKCCEKCGVLQKCYKRKSYLKRIKHEVLAIVTSSVIFGIILFLIEYKIIQKVIKYVGQRTYQREHAELNETNLADGYLREISDSKAKEKELMKKHPSLKDTFGEYLLAVNVSMKERDRYMLEHVYLAVGKSEIVSLSGLKRHGRVLLCEILAGLKIPDEGSVWTMSEVQLNYSPHEYAQNCSICYDEDPLPNWMSVLDALYLIGILRGIPKDHVLKEINNHLQALGLLGLKNCKISRLRTTEKRRLNFAAAVIGAPPVIVLDECTAYQNFEIRRAMYAIMYELRKRGHGILISASIVESHMPVTNRLAILVDGKIQDIDQVNNLLSRYSNKGYTVVIHLKDEVDLGAMFAAYFASFHVNDSSDVLANIQITDDDLSWDDVFERMELLKKDNEKSVYSYIVTVIPLDYIYNNMLSTERGVTRARICSYFKKFIRPGDPVVANSYMLEKLKPFEKSYDITSLTKLPWSVIFHR